MDDEFDSAKPLRGVVVCCTSVPPELRENIAKKTAELGGEHKYDLTHDCTHLIVGDYDTPKYRHVAKERPDIKAMAIGWVDAIRNLWIKCADIDFDAVEKEWQLLPFETGGGAPTLDGTTSERGHLLCCMTGFEDPDERQKIAETIQANGGVYTGDLTKRVTHLIAYKAEGRKYQAARNWGLHTVSVDWVNDSVARGMILDEKCYDPALPAEQRGVGAWVKRAISRTVSLGKRARGNAAPEEGKRKMRKTASMKLSSQLESMWDDIRKSSRSEPQSAAVETAPVSNMAPPAAPSRSKSMDTQSTKLSSFGASEDGRVFAACGFYVHGFSAEKTSVVINTISSLGGLICHSVDEIAGESGAQLAHRFLVVPQLSRAEEHPPLPDNVHIITEFYIERCMFKNYFFDPRDYIFGRPFPVFPISGFEQLTICTAGFTGVDLNHMDKALRQLGAKYEERFTADASVLVCPSLSVLRQEKLQMALTWQVPVVKAEWLWECISAGANAPIVGFLFAELRQDVSQPKRSTPPEGGTTAKTTAKRQDKPAGIDQDLLPKQPSKSTANTKARHRMDASGFSPSNLGGSGTSGSRNPVAAERCPPQVNQSMTTTTTHFETAPTHQFDTESLDTVPSANSSGSKSAASAPLSETSANALNRTSQSLHKPTSPRKPLSRVASEIADSEATDSDLGVLTPVLPPPAETPATEKYEAPTPKADPEPEPKIENPEAMHKHIEAEKDAQAAAERLALSTKLTTTLLSSEPPDSVGPLPSAAPRRRKRQVLGRAISNVSAASSGSDRDWGDTIPAPGSGSLSAAPSFAAPPDASADKITVGDLPPSGTQIKYEDPHANMAAKANLLHKIRGKKGAAPEGSGGREKLTFSDIGGFDGMGQQREVGGYGSSGGGQRRTRRRPGF